MAVRANALQMTTERLVALATILLLAAGCSTTREPVRPLDWVEPNNGRIQPRANNQVPLADIYQLEGGAETAVRNWMRQQSVHIAELEEVPAGLLDEKTAKLRDGGGEIYIARALSDDYYGAFSAFAAEGALLVLYNRMGSCERLNERVVAVRLKDRPFNVYAGCSAAR